MGSLRLPLSSILVVTAISLVVAGVVVLVLGGVLDDDGSDDRAEQAGDSSGNLSLTPEGELPESVEAVVLGAMDGGADRTLGEVLGDRPVVVNFFASWCRPCREEMPAFEQVHQDLGDQVQFVGLAEPPDDAEEARSIVEQTGVTYPTYLDPQGAALTYFEGLVMPTTVFLGADGEVLEVNSRELDESDLRALIEDNFGIAA